MTTRARRLGQLGEEAAREFLAASGYRIRETNVRTRFGEIDIVAEEDGVLVFIEVKARRENALVEPFAAVGREKQRRLARLAREYIAQNRLDGRPARFDVVAVWERKGELRLEVLQNAFEVVDGW